MSGVPRFSYLPEEIKNIANTAIPDFEAGLNTILNIPQEKRSFHNTILAFENARDRLTFLVQIPQFLALVSEDAEVRKASEELRLKMGRYFVDLMTREDIFDVFNEYAQKGENLQPQEERLLKKRLLDFRKNGLGLDTRTKSKVRKILKDLVALNLDFQKNLKEVKDALEVTEDELKGLPADYKARLKRTPAGGYLVTMDYPDYNPFMENAESESARRRLFVMFNCRCAGTNLKLLENAIALRRKLAKLLGYASYADYVLDDRMAKNSVTVLAFLERLQAKLKKKAGDELRARLNIMNGGKILNAWETAYHNNQLKKTGYSVDHEKIKEYFPLETVLNGMFEVFGELLGFSFVSAQLPVWNNDVRAYKVCNADGSVAAYFYLDLFPREGKYKHSFCYSLRPGYELEDGAYGLPAAAILANFSAPSGGAQPLLKFGEVHTLFHEFGHVLQLIFSRAKYSRLGSVNAAWDFVEVPSTTLQQWAYEPSVLRRVSGHYKNNEKLPEEIIKNLIAAKNMDSGLYYLRMIALSMIDMRYHSTHGKVDTTRLYEKIIKKTSLVGIAEGTNPEASFSHLMGGYSAGYYSYIWAEVIAADIFGMFQSAGVMDPETGKRYRELILAPGASLDEAGQIEKFLGRPFREAAFLKSVGAA